MSQNLTQEEINASIKKQRKAIYLVIPITIILVSLAFYAGVKMIYNDKYYMQLGTTNSMLIMKIGTMGYFL